MSHLRQQFRTFTVTALIGICVGIAAAAFEYCLKWVFHHGIVASSHLPIWIFALSALSLGTGGALVTGWLMSSFAPDAPGSGIPQVKLAYNNKKNCFSWSLIWVKFLGGVFSIGTGSSLGREGPTIHIGAAIASRIAAPGRESEEARTNAICAGAAAGLAAAFNSPLAGMTLVLEAVAQNQNMDRYTWRCLLASAIAVSMIYLLKGDTTVFPINEELHMSLKVMWLAPIISLFAAMVGVFFQWAIFKVRGAFKRSSLPFWLRPAIGAAIGAVICLIAFSHTSQLGAFGLGDGTLQEALIGNHLLWSAAAWLLVAKVIATILCFGAGGCGGIFSPLIFFGAMSGIVVYGLTEGVVDLREEDQVLFCLIGMTACLSSVVRTPLTSILIVFEMTGQIYVLPGLMIAAVMAAFINTLFFKYNFYDAVLDQDRKERAIPETACSTASSRVN